MGKYVEIKCEIVVSEPENHNLRRKTAIKIEMDFSRKKKQFLIADKKLQVDQIERKKEANLNKSLFT